MKTRNCPLIKIDGRGVVLDVLAVDSDNRFYNIEIQRDNGGAGSRRPRYNSAMIDASQPKERSGRFGCDLPETYIIVITEKDYWKQGQAIYVFERKCTLLSGVELPLNDGLHIIYVNASYDGDDDMGQLMRDLCARSVSEMSESILKEKASFYKGEVKEDRSMNDYIKEVFKEEIEDAVEDAVKIQMIKQAVKLLQLGDSLEKVAFVTGLSLETVKGLFQTA